ncbi:MAG: phenylalanine--tRNA ligase subunit beta [Chloroflexota bacterium]|nr:phenylalanine--tRNA ligase subunit beta [Chloroflexota bacterium]
MLVPISWIKDYVDIDIPVELLAEKLTVAGLEVAHLRYIGLPQADVPGLRMPRSDHLVWDREKLLLARVVEVKAHPNADKLVLAMVDYGGEELEQCVTGASNLFKYQGQGEINPPIWGAFAMEGARVWDGHSDKPRQMTLKGKELRGIYNKSMVCSEKELGISEEHEGVIILDHEERYVAGAPLAEILGDVILDIEFTPNLARCFSMIGVAREVAAILGLEMRYPSFEFLAEGDPIEEQVKIDIREPELNPRFTLTLLRDTEVKPSPFWMRHRLRLIGQRPRNNIVDVTNYITFELGQPLHAFDYDKLLNRAGGPPTIITRLPEAGERLETLDGLARDLGEETILVADTAGALAIGGVIGGGETEISENTRNVLLEAAAWNNISVRKTIKQQRIHTEASARFSRGVHPSQSILGSSRGIELMRQLGGGTVAAGLVDAYPAPPQTVTVALPIERINALLGMDIETDQAAEALRRLEFETRIDDDVIHATAPDHRLDISADPIVGQADLLEEIARVLGYDRIPETIMADEMPPQRENPGVFIEERVRDILAGLGLYEVINYRFSNRETEAMLTPDGAASSLPDAEYVEIVNPAASDRDVLRHTLMTNMLETAANNARYQRTQQVFEIGKVYLQQDAVLPEEPLRLAILLTGARDQPTWRIGDAGDAADALDFYDLKGVIESLLEALHIDDFSYERATHSSFHPGRSANLLLRRAPVGAFGEIHPQVAQRFRLADSKVFYAELEVARLLQYQQRLHKIEPLLTTPAILEDIALIVDANVAAHEVERVIRQAGGRLLKDVTLFDVYTGDPVPPGKKSLAYSLTYQDPERTLTDKNAAKARKKIIGAARHRLRAELRS